MKGKVADKSQISLVDSEHHILGGLALTASIQQAPPLYSRLYITVEKGDVHYVASCPSLLGCIGQGSSKEEAVEELRWSIKQTLDRRGFAPTKDMELVEA